MATNIDTYIPSLDIYLDDYSDMTEKEFDLFIYQTYQNLVDQGYTEEKIDEFKDRVRGELNVLHDELFVLQRQLEDIIESNDSTVEEKSKAELYLDEILQMLETTEWKNFNSEFGNAVVDYQAHNVRTEGQYHRFEAASDTENGEEFLIDTTGMSASTQSPQGIDGEDSLFAPPPENTANTNTTTDAETEIEETNPAQEIIRAQEQALHNHNVPEVEIVLDATDIGFEIASYNPDTGAIRLAITKANGNTYYVTITGEPPPNIRISGGTAGLTPEYIADVWHPDLQQRFYQNNSAYSFAYLIWAQNHPALFEAAAAAEEAEAEDEEPQGPVV